jgi:hypothetical protein
LNFPILNNYLVEKHGPCPRATVAAINVYNKCDSKYTMRLATKVQMVEL